MIKNLPLLVYDGDCILCKLMADYLEPISQNRDVTLTRISWQELREHHDARNLFSTEELQQKSPRKLYIIHLGQVHSDVAAWRWLLNFHPALHKLSWLARRLNLETTAATSLHLGATTLKRACLWCRPW